MSFSERETHLIGNIADVQTGPFGSQLHKSDYVKKGTPIITVEHLGKRRLSRDSTPFVCEEDKARLSKYSLKTGDIVFSRVGSVDRCSLVSKDENGWLFSGRCLRVRPNTTVLHPKYLYYYFCLENMKEYIRSIAVGATMPSINTKILSEVKIAVPQIKIQKAIAATLSCLDDKIDHNNKINKTLEEMAQAIFKSWFVDFDPFQDGEFEESELGRIPKGWRVIELWDMAKFIKGKKPKKLLDIKENDGVQQYLTINVLNGNAAQFADAEKMILANEYDILMVMDGASSGSVYFGLNGIVGSTIAKLEVINIQLKEVIYQYLKNNESEVRAYNTGSAIPHTDKGYVLGCKLAVPPDRELDKMADVLRKIREAIIQNGTQIKNLVTTRDTLLPKLMSGEIRVPIEEVQ